MIFILLSSDLAWYLEEYLMYKHHTYWLSQYGPRIDDKINVGNSDLYLMIQWVCLLSWREFINTIISIYEPV